MAGRLPSRSRRPLELQAGTRGTRGLAGGVVLFAAVATLTLSALPGFLHAGATRLLGGVHQRPCRWSRPLAVRQAKLEEVEVAGEVLPLSSYLLVKPKEAVTSTKGGLLLPGSKEKPSEGEVLAVGPGEVDEDSGLRTPIWVKAGMKVLYSKYGTEEVKYNGEPHVLVRDSDVLLSYSGDEPTLENIEIPRGKVLLQLFEDKAESAGGILLSKGAAKTDTNLGKVVAVSDGVLNKRGELVPLDISLGDTVRFRYGSEVKLEVGKAEFRAVDATDCLAKWH